MCTEKLSHRSLKPFSFAEAVFHSGHLLRWSSTVSATLLTLSVCSHLGHCGLQL